MKINPKLFNRLLTLKKEGYTYLTSLSNDNYTDYDQAVQDCYEMDGNEPSYGDWVKESLQYYEIDKYVTFHDGLLIIGESTTRYYDTESFDLDYDCEQFSSYVQEMIAGDTIWRNTDREAVVGGDARYADLVAYAIWNLGFEKADQTINSIDQYNNIYSDSEKIYISFRLDETEGAVKTVFVKDELWQDVDFLNEILKLNVPTEIVLSFLPESFKQNNDDFYRDLFLEDPSVFMFCPEKMRADKAIVISAVSNDGKALEYASEELKADKEVALAAISNNLIAFKYVPPSLALNHEISKIFISNVNIDKDKETLEDLSKEIKTNKDFILELVTQNGLFLEYASEELQSDKEIVLAAVTNNGEALRYANEEFLKSREFVLLAAKTFGWVFDIKGSWEGFKRRCVPSEFKADKEIVMTALANDGTALQLLSDEMKADKEVVLFAFSNGCKNLYHVSDELKADKDVVLAAVSNDGNTLKYASDVLKADKEVVMKAISCEGLYASSYCIKYALKEFNPDKEMVLAIVSKLGNALEYAPQEFKADKEVVMKAISCEGLYASSYCIKYALKEFNPDKEMVIEIVSKLGDALEHATDTFKSDKEVVMAAIANDGRALEYASNELKSEKEIVLAAITNNGEALEYASDEFKSDKEIVMAAVSQNGYALKQISDELKADKEVVMAAVSNNQFALKFASDKLQNDPDILALKG